MRKLHILSCMMAWAMTAFSYTISEYDRQVFIDSFAELAVEEMKLHGIPASITLAQAILESSWGLGEVATGANNYFCIKCYNGWEGPTFNAKDDEPGLSCFRKYNSIHESFRDHSSFLKDNDRYQPLFQFEVTDYQNWARGLKACGYATDDSYGEKLIGLIEAYGLWMYDRALSTNDFVLLDAPVLSEPGGALIRTAGPDEPVYPGGQPGRNSTGTNLFDPSGVQTLEVPSWDLNNRVEGQPAADQRSDSQETSPAGMRKRKIRPIMPEPDFDLEQL